MPIWAGIDEAGYGPRLGPLVVAAAAFSVGSEPAEGMLWQLLRDGVSRRARGSDGRLVVNDSKRVYSSAAGLRRLEEGVLAFVAACRGRRVGHSSALFELLEGGRRGRGSPAEWFSAAADLSLPLESNASALSSKAEVLRQSLDLAGARVLAMRAAVVCPGEFNRVVSRTRNKSLLLFQQCGLLLQEVWQLAGPGTSYVLVDRHGGRRRYRRLLRDVFPDCSCDVLREERSRSAYRIGSGDRCMVVGFKEDGDLLALPTALASMTAKYVRELHMLAFNGYWRERMARLQPEAGGEHLKPTAGYSGDARRFIQAIAPALQADGVDPSRLLRAC